MKTRILLAIIVLVSGILACDGGNCVTGKVVSNSESNGTYYLSIAVEHNAVFTGEIATVEVSKNEYIQDSVGHVVTICK